MLITDEMVSAAARVVPELPQETVRQILVTGTMQPTSVLPVIPSINRVSTAMVDIAREGLEEVLQILGSARKDMKSGQQALLDSFTKDCEAFIHNMLLAEGHPAELARRVQLELQRK